MTLRVFFFLLALAISAWSWLTPMDWFIDVMVLVPTWLLSVIAEMMDRRR